MATSPDSCDARRIMLEELEGLAVRAEREARSRGFRLHEWVFLLQTAHQLAAAAPPMPDAVWERIVRLARPNPVMKVPPRLPSTGPR